jgi:predicted ATPase
VRLECVYARFYKSFNFDSVRKSHPDAKPDAWDKINGDFYPYVAIPIDPHITAVVGANESGKSHLLGAIRKAITAEGIEQRDLCRYSPFFSVERGMTSWPHLGLKWSSLNSNEVASLTAAIPNAPEKVTAFHMFREGPDVLRLFFPQQAGEPIEISLSGEEARKFGHDFLPRPFEIKADVGLPSAVPLAWLRDEVEPSSLLNTRQGRASLLEAGALILDHLPADAQQFAGVASNLFPQFNSFRTARRAAGVDEDPKALRLARDLLVRLALIDPDRLADLAKAIDDGDDGHANALVARINQQLARHLNFPKFWVQDRDFSIKVSPRDVDLVFTIQDRTGTEYTFAERSHGLKYFLSYLIQAQTREPSTDRAEILLMDEPDAFLSAEAQQDLLKIFDGFAHPEGGTRPIQVVYVTHSPFLLDKNRAERIRVLQKGRASEGTRVIRNASRNHYEPLRSAFGAFVGETAFIGSCNLLVEGAADQVLLAGASRLIRAATDQVRSDSLDLNRIVIVPCGSAGQMPYTVYLVRGRDTEKPPVIALLDSDSAGRDAAKALRGGEKRIGRLIKPEYVLDIASITEPDGDGRAPIEIEDLVPHRLAVRAANEYFREIEEFRGERPTPFTVEELPSPLPVDQSVFGALNALAEQRGRHIDKIGFARAVISICEQAKSNDADVVAFLTRMRPLFRKLNEVQRAAERDASRARISTLVDRLQMNFGRDHPDAASVEQALHLIEDVTDVLDDSREADAVRTQLLQLRRDFALDDQETIMVHPYNEFRVRLEGLKHSFEHVEQNNTGSAAVVGAKGFSSKPTKSKRSGVI